MGKTIKNVGAVANRQHFSKEFKLEAVRLLELGQKPATQLALELGIPRNRLYKWQTDLKKAEIYGVRLDLFCTLLKIIGNALQQFSQVRDVSEGALSGLFWEARRWLIIFKILNIINYLHIC